MKVLVIIVSYNSMPWIDRCYNSIKTSSIHCDVLTIDNGSIDGTVDYIRSYFPEVGIVENRTNLGFGMANNIGLKKALDNGYDYVYLLNQDAWIKPDTIEKLIETSRKYPEYGILSPIQLQANEEHIDYGFLNWSIGMSPRSKPQMMDDLYFDRVQDVYEVDFVMAAHWLITRKCIEIVGGFSPTFFQYGEDDNYIHRAKYWNFKVGVVPNCKAIHDREDRKITESYKQYMILYVNNLKNFSNPIVQTRILPFVKFNLKLALIERNVPMLRYTWRIFKEKNQILKNLQESKSLCAFLEKV